MNANVTIKRHAYDLIASDILCRIMNGEWAVSEKIDSVDKLVKKYPYSRMTIVKALNHLEEQGYLKMKKGSGSYVEKKQPQLCIGMLFPQMLIQHNTPTFISLICQELKRFFTRVGAEVKLYLGENPRSHLEWTELPQELTSDLRKKKLHGLICIDANASVSLMATDLWKECAIPHVEISLHENMKHRVYVDYDRMLKDAIELAVARKKPRIALIGFNRLQDPAIIETLSHYDAFTKPEWIQPFSEESNSSLEGFGYVAINEIFKSEERPETLIIMNDIIAKGASQALLNLRISTNDLLLITHANKGEDLFYPVPMLKLEFDPSEIVNAAGQMLLDLIGNNAMSAKTVLVPPHLIDNQ